MPPDLIHDKSTMVRQWLGAVGQQAITCTNVDQDLQRDIASQGHNELKDLVDKCDYI